jgi:hypothetical protein
MAPTKGILSYRGQLGLPMLLGSSLCWLSVQAEPQGNGCRNAEIYQRATHVFAQASLFKPAQCKPAGLEYDLAPLILQEVSAAKDSSAANNLFGTLSLSNNVLRLDCSRPAVYVTADSVHVNAKPHARLSYLWFYPLAPSQGKASVLSMQGVRLTLDVNGKPAVWEVLADNTSAQLVFVSQSLEMAARAEYGRPLVGRRFAIERGLTEETNVVVARVIEDGSVPMGPILYLNAGTHPVSTLICRCMTAQAKSLLQTSAYELEDGESIALLACAEAQCKTSRSFWPGDPRTDKRLEACLRLPQLF